MYSNLFDSHLHTDNSRDGHHSAMMLCEFAEKRGLSGIAITDHCEIQKYRQDQYDLRIRQSYFEACKAKAVFGRRLIISAGVEVGQPLEDPAQADALLAEFKFDFVLCSVHNLVRQLDFKLNNYTGYSPEQISDVFKGYLGLVYKTVRWDKFDSLAHLTYPLRYIVGMHKMTVRLDDHYEMIDEILKLLAQNGRALELNTSGLWQSFGEPMPPFHIISRFREHGGERVTIGSDAHRAYDIGKGITDAMEYLHSAGFRYFAFYRNREVNMLRII